MTQDIQFCPVCRRSYCGHLLSSQGARDHYQQTLDLLQPAAKTPLDLGVARFAADLIALMRAA